MHRLLSLSTTALFLLISPLFPARAADPEFSKGVFTVAGTVPGVSLQQVANGLGPVTSIANAGDGRLFLTAQTGRILILENGTPRPQPFLDIRGRITTDGERGLLSVAFHPRYAENGFFFVNYTNLQGDTVIARYQVSAANPNRPTRRARGSCSPSTQPYPNHNGGQLAVRPRRLPLHRHGRRRLRLRSRVPRPEPGHAPRQDAAHRRRSERRDAALLRHPGLAIPSAARRAAGRDLGASGLRNPWRFSFDRADRRPLDRRRRPEPARGDRLPAGARRAAARTTAGR